MRGFRIFLSALLLASAMAIPAATLAQVSSGSSDDAEEPAPEPSPSRSGGGGQKWGAVGRFEGSFYGAWAYGSEDEARSAVKKNCEKKHGKGKCFFTTFSGTECWALARAVPDRGGWGQGTGIDLNAALKLAMKRCKDGAEKCKKSFTFCADGTNMFNDR